jgi:hypothetical protein
MRRQAFFRSAVRSAIPASAVLMLGVPAVALGARSAGGGTKQGVGTPLSLVSEYVHNSPNPAAPTTCLNEDDYHQRTWGGTLSGNFSATERLCDSNVDYSGGIWWDAGGIGLQASVDVVGALSDLTISSPQGDSHHAALVSSSTTKGVTTNRYEVCYVPAYSISTDTGGAPLPGGTWQITLSGNVTKATYSVTAAMTDVTFQQQNCPASGQNLTP